MIDKATVFDIHRLHDTGLLHLARCFVCEKNFNTIDPVMAVKNCGFKDSVLFLKTLTATQKVSTQALKVVVTSIAKPLS